MCQDFGKSYRLLKTDEYSSVFALRRAKNLASLRIYFADNQLKHCRLGLVVSKKVAKRAHERNYMKRVLREWFRRHKAELPHQDWVIQVREKFEKQDYQCIIKQLDQYLLFLKTRSKKR